MSVCTVLRYYFPHPGFCPEKKNREATNAGANEFVLLVNKTFTNTSISFHKNLDRPSFFFFFVVLFFVFCLANTCTWL